jgi:hypothetical protein
MTQPSHERRFERAARENPAALDAYTRQVLGVPADVARLYLQVHASLIDGHKVTPQMVRAIQAANPTTYPHEIADLAQALNSVDPGSRPARFLAVLAGDVAAMGGNFSEAGETYRALDAFTSDFHAHAAAARISARADANLDPDIAARRIEREPEDPRSTRALIEAQLGGQPMKDARYIAAEVERGDPDMLRAVGSNLADTMERSIERLQPEADVSLRETLSAAADWHEAEAVAVDQGMVPEASS